MRTVTVWLVVVTLAPGCTSLHSVRLESANPFATIRIGDVVNVHTSDGRQDEFNVARISTVEIVGTEGQTYQAGEITRLQRRTFSGGKTAALGVGIGLFLLLAYAIAYASALGSIMSPQ
jgi:hypothetical protein